MIWRRLGGWLGGLAGRRPGEWAHPRGHSARTLARGPRGGARRPVSAANH